MFAKVRVVTPKVHESPKHRIQRVLPKDPLLLGQDTHGKKILRCPIARLRP